MKHWKNWQIHRLERKDFPNGLKVIKDQPKTMYFRGEWDINLFSNTIAMVGSRKMTRYGETIIEKMMPAIVGKGITVISGFMYGVDTQCHRQCLDFGGKTIAVVGGGLDKLAPTSNDQLYSEILENGGLVMSEYEADFQPTTWSFPQRDRLMSAMATVGILVIEGGIKSGSLITAKYGLKHNKKVMAVPGPINSSVSEGTNWLIKSGAAKMVTSSADIFDDEIKGTHQEILYKDFKDLSIIEKNIVGILENESITIDELSKKLKLSVVETNKTISLMLMRDLIEEEGGKVYLS
ncbi:MAG: DNA-processing protein DprA [Candidatus Shapirobacteria bacterium]|jgi:DNA processing protein